MRRHDLVQSAIVSLIIFGLCGSTAKAADHNDPNSINSIFAGTNADPADLYDFFGWPSEDVAGGEKVVVALTFASVPSAGVFDPDMLYRVLIAPTPRLSSSLTGEGISSVLRYFAAVAEKYGKLNPGEVRVTFPSGGKAQVAFSNFRGASFSTVVDTNTVATIQTPAGQAIKAFIGGRDDAFFNDLPGFFRSINYAPQFYNIPEAMKDARELSIPKTLLELEHNKLFNFDPANPDHGQGVKLDRPSGPLTWSGSKFSKDSNGDYRFVYSGRDAQAGKNVNAIILEIPLAFLTTAPDQDRVVNAWGESWVRKASGKIADIPNDRAPVRLPFYLLYHGLLSWGIVLLGVLLFALGIRSFLRSQAERAVRTKLKHWLKPLIWIAAGLVFAFAGLTAAPLLAKLASKKPVLALSQSELDAQLQTFKLIDTDGQPFADAALNERENDKQLGAYNASLGLNFVVRLAHLGWGFGPSIGAIGLRSSFDYGDVPVSMDKTYSNALTAFPRSRKVVFQKLNMPDDSWHKPNLNIPLKTSIEIFVPNVCAIDMDTTGTWPYGRRLEDQVATRFLSLFLDMEQEVAGKKCNIETLNDPNLWAGARIQPKVPPNPQKNDKAFLKEFPYLAEPW